MAALRLSPSLTLPPNINININMNMNMNTNMKRQSKSSPKFHGMSGHSGRRQRVSAYKVVIEQGEKVTEVEIDEDETILSRALDMGLDVPHDCKLGVCMTCPAKLVSGKVDQSEGMLSDDVIERGYALTCAAYPRSDCHIKIIPEEELLSLQLATAND